MSLPLALGLFAVCGVAPAPAVSAVPSTGADAGTPVAPAADARLARPDGSWPAAPADTVLARLWSEGQEWDAFLDDTRRRRDTWHDNYERAEVFADLAARLEAVPGTWRLLVVAVDACGDSANTIPYLARFVEAVDGLEMRVVEPDEGRPVMDAHPTPDGRGATPTVVVMDAEGANRGCWVERPAGIQSWWITNPDGLSTRDKLERKYAWYDDDAGYHTILEIVESVEAAANGGHVCGRPVDAEAGWPAAGPSGGR